MAVVATQVPDTTLGSALCAAVADTAPTAACFRRHPLNDAAELVLAEPARAVAVVRASLLAAAAVALEPITPRLGLARLTGTWEQLNMLRRALLTRVPVLACTQARLIVNGGLDSDEILAHRLGQVVFRVEDSPPPLGPLTATAPTTHQAVIGPLQGPCVVRGQHIRPRQLGLVVENALAPLQLVPEGGALHVELELGWGRGFQHAKFAAVASPAIWPRLPAPEIFPEPLRAAGYRACDGLLEAPGAYPWRCRAEHVRELCDDAYDPWSEHGPRAFVLEVETLGQHSPEVCWTLALAALVEELDDLEKKCLDVSEPTASETS